MSRDRLWIGVLFGLALSGGLRAEINPKTIAINPKGYTSSTVCGQCHEEIYKTWKNSMHAASYSDPIFQTAFVQAVTAEGEKARRFCLGCHAPTVLAAAGPVQEDALAREGITCDFCHTVKAVKPDGSGHSFTTEPGLVKRSVLRQTSSPVHQVAYSAVHETAEFCAGCHQLLGKNGVLILGTYSEWKAGPYAEEKRPCQSCHMPLGSGATVRPEVATSGRHQLNLHDISGAHSEEMFRKALKLELGAMTWEGDLLQIPVTVTNQGAGHVVPTGMPTRKIRLGVRVLDGSGRVVASQERYYGRVLSAADGRILNHDWEIMLYATGVESDNRLRPRESREENFAMRVSKRPGLTVEADLAYTYVPELIQPKEMGVEFLTIKQEIH